MKTSTRSRELTRFRRVHRKPEWDVEPASGLDGNETWRCAQERWAPRDCSRRLKTVELVGVQIGWNETELRAAVKKTAAIRRPRQKLWEMSWQAYARSASPIG